ncbi:MAG: PEP-CTERM sorting domain-containing protein [Cyanobacteria bacterium SBLK]|nr:PEP-CTERM sorting domain-containing protein [Cyanobacteria bacterium SBLK]
MKSLVNRTKSLLILGAMTITGTICLNSTPTLAGTLHGDWNYSIDSSNDSMAGNHVGGTKYEIFSMAMKQTADEIIMAINTNFGIDGASSQYANDGHVSWGDMLLNFTDLSLDAASNAAQLFGIRFAANNESGVPELGVYENVIGKTIARENGLLLQDASLRGYNNWVSSRGGHPQIGELSANDPYFSQDHHIQNVIASGNKIGDVNLLSDLSNLGLDFGHFGATGTQTIAFSFARDLLPDGSFIAHLAPECDNDVIAMRGLLETPPEPVPEPSAALALGAFGLLFSAKKMRRRHTS